MNTSTTLFGIFAVRWYGIIVALAILVGLFIILWQVRRRYEEQQHALLLVLLCIPCAILASRLYYVLFNWDLFKNNIWEVFFLWHGGLAFHGALFGGVAVVCVYAKRNRLSLARWLDRFAPALACGQAIGQWANFVNQEVLGYPTDALWGIYVDFAYRPEGYEQYDFFQPVCLFESGWEWFLFLLLAIVGCIQGRKRYVPPGTQFLLYLVLYSAGRFYFEGLRLDSEMLGPFRLAQVVCVLTILFALVLFVRQHALFRVAK